MYYCRVVYVLLYIKPMKTEGEGPLTPRTPPPESAPGAVDQELMINLVWPKWKHSLCKPSNHNILL